MKRILIFILLCCQCVLAVAQKDAPKWKEKALKAIVTVTTYGKDGNQQAAGIGFFISETGEAVSSYTLFKGATKATVTDMEGKVMAVESILGADEMYDVVRFKVVPPKKVATLTIASLPVANGTPAYLLPFAKDKNGKMYSGSITEVSKLKDSFKYYKLSIPLNVNQLNSPLLTADGQVFGLAQADAGGKTDVCYALSIGYASSLTVGSADYLSSVYTNIGIKKTWPKDFDQANVVLYLMGNMQDVKTHLATVNDFIAAFPEHSEGYLNRSNLYAYNRKELASSQAEQDQYLNMALEDIKTAAKYSGKKGDMFYNQAKLIYAVASNDTTLSNPTWTIDAAMDMLQKAIKEDNRVEYHQLEGDIYFSKREFQQAYDAYMLVNNSEAAIPSTYFYAAKALENITGFNIGDVIALLDKAIDKCGNEMGSEAGAYILERINWKLRLQQYTEAVADYNLYYTKVGGQVNSNFYYLREQAKYHANDLEGSLKDIRSAIMLSPETPDYYAEEASVYIRMQKYTEALSSLDKAIELAPDFAACHRLRGVCFVRLGKKTEACEALNKAKSLGDPVADKLIKENCK